MSKQGEIVYIKNIGEAGAEHALNKPYSDPGCAFYLIEMIAILSLLPQPPDRLLDLGAGTGWTSVMFARYVFDVLGQDIAPDMVKLANKNRYKAGLKI